VKKLLLAGTALALIASHPARAADLPAKTYTKTPAYVAPVYNWTGFYVGGHIGGGWSDLGSTELAPGSVSFPAGTVFTKNNLSGFLGGLQGGFNWQAANNFVVGIEGEYTWSDLRGTETTISGVNGFSSTTTARTKDLALVTGRVGYAAAEWLFYAKGGGAWGQGSSSGIGTLANGTFFDTTSSAPIAADGLSVPVSNGALRRIGRQRSSTIISTLAIPTSRSSAARGQRPS